MYGKKCTSYHSCYLVSGTNSHAYCLKVKTNVQILNFLVTVFIAKPRKLMICLVEPLIFLGGPSVVSTFSPQNYKQMKLMIICQFGFCEDFQFEILFHTFSEVEIESNSNMAKVPNSSSPCSLSPNRISLQLSSFTHHNQHKSNQDRLTLKFETSRRLRKQTFSDTAGREATRGATTLLKVNAPHTEGVGFVPPLPEASSPFPLFGSM